MLATRFPRHPGDVGNPASFPFPVLYRRVEAARVAAIVREGPPEASLAAAIVAAARELEAEGAGLVTTSCGFLSSLQDELEAALSVPVLASALGLLPDLRRGLGPDAAIGVLTFDSRRLGPAHLPPGCGPLLIGGLEAGAVLHPAIAGDWEEMDFAAAEADALACTRALLARGAAEGRRPAALLLECTNLSPYREAIAAETGLPVHDLTSELLRRAASREERACGQEGA